MTRIIIAGASETSCMHLSRLLASYGFTVFRCCASGGELRRALNACGSCVVILLGVFPEGRPDDLQTDFGGSAQFLWIAKPDQLQTCESPQVFRLPLPVSGQKVVDAVEMLAQMPRLRPPHRSDAEQHIVDEAKALLIRERGMTEPEAHHALQQYAMRRGQKLADYAARILQMAHKQEDS